MPYVVSFDIDQTLGSFWFLDKINSTCERMGTIYIKYTLGILGIASSLFLISVLYGYLSIGHLIVDDLYHPVQLVYLCIYFMLFNV